MAKTFLLARNNIFWKKNLSKGNFCKQISKKVVKEKFSKNQISTVATLPRTKAGKVLVYLISGTLFFGGRNDAGIYGFKKVVFDEISG